MYLYPTRPSYAEFSARKRAMEIAKQLYEAERKVANSAAAGQARQVAKDAAEDLMGGVQNALGRVAKNRKNSQARQLASKMYGPGSWDERYIARRMRDQPSRSALVLRDPNATALATRPGGYTPNESSAIVLDERGGLSRMSPGDPMPVGSSDMVLAQRGGLARIEDRVPGRGRSPAEVNYDDQKVQGLSGTALPEQRVAGALPTAQEDVIRVGPSRDGRRRAHTRKRTRRRSNEEERGGALVPYEAPGALVEQPKPQTRRGMSRGTALGLAAALGIGAVGAAGAAVGIPLALRQRREAARREQEQQMRDADRYGYGDYRYSPRTANFGFGGLGAIKKPRGILGKSFLRSPNGFTNPLNPDQGYRRKPKFIRRDLGFNAMRWL